MALDLAQNFLMKRQGLFLAFFVGVGTIAGNGGTLARKRPRTLLISRHEDSPSECVLKPRHSDRQIEPYGELPSSFIG
ncbi:hypothetical protein CN186_22640 [Sinorhizobium medicae]|nr:hypothetical protein CN186_22640 [Sinorhizobium medicae]